jgi:hypothetical protein
VKACASLTQRQFPHTLGRGDERCDNRGASAIPSHALRSIAQRCVSKGQDAGGGHTCPGRNARKRSVERREAGVPITLTGRIEAEDEVTLAFRIEVALAFRIPDRWLLDNSPSTAYYRSGCCLSER